jgi:hypothetical protein
MTATAASQPDLPTDEALGRVEWRISSRSESGGGSCVEAGPLIDGTGRVAVRHSHHRQNGPVIVYMRTEWDAFITGVKAGEFDFNA